MHRNTLLLTVFLAVIAALLIGINVGKNLSGAQSSANPSPTAHPTATPKPITSINFTSQTCGITFTYPSNLTQNESTESGTTLSDPAHPDETISLACQPGIPRPALTADKMESLTVYSTTGEATAAAKLYHDTSAIDGTPLDRLIFTNRKTGSDIYIAGFGKVFTNLIDSLRLL